MIGSKGIPAAYGGFETFVDKLTERKHSDKLVYHVSCWGQDNKHFVYNDAKCYNIKMPNIGPAKAIYGDVVAMHRAIRACKTAGVTPYICLMACRMGPFVGYFKRQIEKMGGFLYVNPDGHEWKRSKWSAPVRAYWKISERLTVKHADYLICDSRGIEEYIQTEYAQYHPQTTFIAYGSEFSTGDYTDEECGYTAWCREHGLTPGQYYLNVGRFVPENNYEAIIREFIKSGSEKDLVIITTENKKFYDRLEKKYHFSGNPHIKFVGTVYDSRLLQRIREKAFASIHGHSVGGTNPSLVEALGTSDLNLLYAVKFNQEVALDTAMYWDTTEGSLADLMQKAEQMPEAEIKELGQKAHKRVADAYNWELITRAYENVFLNWKKA